MSPPSVTTSASGASPPRCTSMPESRSSLFDVGNRRAHPVDAQRHRRRFVVERERRERVGPAELVDEHAHDPVRVRSAHAEVHDLVAGGPRPRRPGPRERAEHTVHVAARARARRPPPFRRPPRAPGSRSAAGTAPSRSAARTSGSTSGIACFDTFASWKSSARCMRTVPYTSSVTNPRSRPVSLLRPSSLRHEDVRERAVLDAKQRVERDATRGLDRGAHASITRSSGWPRRHASHAMRRLPSGWISRRCSVPSTVVMPAAPSTPAGPARSVDAVAPNSLNR